MDAIRLAGLARRISVRLTRRASMGLLAGAGLLRLPAATDAKKKKKKITLCVNGQTVKKPKNAARKLQQQGAGKGPCRCGNGGPCLVFYTEARFKGSEIGGLAGADATCTAIANGAGLAGTFKAWLSAADQVPALRFDNVERAGPWVLPRAAGEVANPPTVATDFLDLVTCEDRCLQGPINRNQRGESPLGVTVVWTGTEANGSAAAKNCSGWTSDADEGLVGFSTQDDAAWTSALTFGCNVAQALYCFQQAT